MILDLAYMGTLGSYDRLAGKIVASKVVGLRGLGLASGFWFLGLEGPRG